MNCRLVRLPFGIVTFNRLDYEVYHKYETLDQVFTPLKQPSLINGLTEVINWVENTLNDIPEQHRDEMLFVMDRYDDCVIGSYLKHFNWNFSQYYILDSLFGINIPLYDCYDSPFSSAAQLMYTAEQWKVIRLFTFDIVKKGDILSPITDAHNEQAVMVTDWLHLAKQVLSEISE